MSNEDRRIHAIEAAFPGDDLFAAVAIAKGWTLEQAHAARAQGPEHLAAILDRIMAAADRRQDRESDTRAAS